MQEVSELRIDDALANLNALAEMQINSNEPIGIINSHRLVLQEEAYNYKTIDWFVQEDAEELIQSVKETYKTLLDYLKIIYEKNLIKWDDPKCRKGIQAIMVMASDAATKVDKYIELLPKQPTIEKIEDSFEYKEFRKFYLEKIVKRFSEELEGERPWEDEWRENEKSFLLDIEKSGLKDFEILKKDEEYELFYFADEEEKPFFDPDLIRNIKLFCDYDEKSFENIEEDPFLKVRIFLDKEFHSSSQQILSDNLEIAEYFKERIHRNIENELIILINKTLFSLMLAANPHNLMTHTFYKSSFEYFYDFQNFLRAVLSSDEYQKIMAYPSDDKTTKCIKNLVNSICRRFFLRKTAIKQEMIGFIHLLINKGDEIRKYQYPQKVSFWTLVLENDESIRTLLETFPNGPLIKIYEVIKKRESQEVSFDPFIQNNAAQKMFEISHSKNQLQMIRCPCPTKQSMIDHAQVIEEFKTLLNSLKEDEKYLLVNLQNKASYKEAARCSSIDILQKKGDFRDKIIIVTIDKHSDFYHQSGIYINLNKADDFLKIFKKELYSNEFTSLFVSDELNKFIDKALDFVHKLFFVNKNVLTRRNRLDFIEIFYNFLILKIIEIQNPKILSFTCKDAIDIGSAQLASFYAFLKLIKNQEFTKETEDFFRWLVYTYALLVRERAINSTYLIRTVSSLNTIEIEMLAHKNKILKAISSLYDPSFLKSININDK